MKTAKTVSMAERNEWRAWLARNHQTEKKVWLIYFKWQSGTVLSTPIHRLDYKRQEGGNAPEAARGGHQPFGAQFEVWD
jgi:hypothetical protein